MSIKKEIVKGTLILTAAGIVTRVIGLYNRIYLANIISAAELGLYQLIFPILAVCSSVCCYGIEAALSKIISEQSAGGCIQNMHRTMHIGITIAGSLSAALFAIIYFFAEPLAVYFLKAPACSECLKIAAFVIPFSTLHACTLGYFFGMQSAAVPAASQLLEQLVRVGTIYGLSVTFYAVSGADAVMAVYGMLAGEIVSCVFTIAAYKISIYRSEKAAKQQPKPQSRRALLSHFISCAYPLTINRFALTVLQSFEAVLIPMMLRSYYKESVAALEIYGVITAMVFPFIMFPTTLTNSLATMLMPAVSKAGEEKDYGMIRRTISQSVHYCLLIGILSLAIFFVYGRMFGIIVFKNELAGELLKIFSFLCPFIYIAASLAGTLNGLGKVKITLVNSMISLAVRIFFIVVIIPRAGIRGYLWGQLAGYLVLTFLDGYFVHKMAGLAIHPWKTLVFPVGFAAAAAICSLGVYQWLLYTVPLSPVVLLGISCMVIVLIYGGSLVFSGIIPRKKVLTRQNKADILCSNKRE